MSIFHVREWWSCPKDINATDARYTAGSLCVGQVFNDGSGKEDGNGNLVFTGSLNGLLRVYNPNSSGFNVNDLWLERELDAPILQMELGRFVEDTTIMALAVLHPQSLSVYIPSLAQKGGLLELIQAYTCRLSAEGESFAAATFTYGPMNNPPIERQKHARRDVFAVQSVDGRIQIIEEHGPLYTSPLPELLLAGVLVYLPPIDAIAVGDAESKVRCITCKELTAGATPEPVWEVLVGEEIVDIVPICVHGEHYSMVLGERVVYFLAVKDGRVAHQVKLPVGFHPICCLPYGEEFNQKLIVTSRNGHTMVFHRNKLVWKAMNSELAAPPVAHAVSAFNSIEGFLVVADAFGKVMITFMGTAASQDASMQRDNETTTTSYADTKREYDELVARVKAAERHDETAASQLSRISIHAEIPRTLDELSFEDNALAMDEGDIFVSSNGKVIQLTLRLFFSYFGIESDVLQSVHVALTLPEGVAASEPSFVMTLNKHAKEKKQFKDVTLRVLRLDKALPDGLNVDILATWTENSQTPVVSRTQCRLPLCLMTIPQQLDSANAFKVTLQTNHEAIHIPLLFSDILQEKYVTKGLEQEIEQQTKNGITLQYLSSGDVVTILASNEKYRAQSASLGTLTLAVEELIRRLRDNFDAKGVELRLDYVGNLPLGDLNLAIDEHFAARTSRVELEAELNDRAQLHRQIERRLLSILSDKNTTDVNGLDWLLSRTHDQILDIVERMEEARDRLEAAQRQLSAVVRLLWLLARIRYKLEGAEWRMYSSYLADSVQALDNNCEQLGWEEYTLAQLSYLFRHHLRPAKENDKSKRKALSIKTVRDTQTLKKGIRKLFAHLETTKVTMEAEEKEA